LNLTPKGVFFFVFLWFNVINQIRGKYNGLS